VRVLIVEDDAQLATRLQRAFTDEGFATDLAGDGERADYLGRTEPYDAVVLDLGLPKRDGLAVLSGWRQRGIDVPVLVLTARGRWAEKRAGFEAGADDYLVKPFEFGEAILRVRALVRRRTGHASPTLECGAIVLDTHTGRVTVRGDGVDMTSQEFRVLSYLMHHAERLVSRSELLEHVYARDLEPDSNALDVMIMRVRRKVGVPAIETVRGRGYRMVAVDR